MKEIEATLFRGSEAFFATLRYVYINSCNFYQQTSPCPVAPVLHALLAEKYFVVYPGTFSVRHYPTEIGPSAESHTPDS